MVRKILALDLSVSNTGWAFGISTRHPKHFETGCESFKLGTPTAVKKMGFTEEQIKGEQAIRFQKWVRNLIRTMKPDQICVEKSFLNLNPSTEILIGLRIILLQTARYLDIPVTSYSTSSLKALALEPGYAKRYKELSDGKRRKAIKAEMVSQMQKVTGDPTPVTDDEADAFWCLMLHIEKTRKQLDLTLPRSTKD